MKTLPYETDLIRQRKEARRSMSAETREALMTRSLDRMAQED
jgi:hypothetical protein